jgi:hypothetical protein
MYLDKRTRWDAHEAQQKLIASGRDCASLKYVVLYLSLSRWTKRRF